MTVDATKLSFGLSCHVINEIKSVFSKHSTITRVCLFGSRAKGTYRTGSDIDLVVMENSLEKGELLKVESDLDDLMLPYTIDLLVFERLDNAELVSHIKRIGIDFYKA